MVDKRLLAMEDALLRMEDIERVAAMGETIGRVEKRGKVGREKEGCWSTRLEEANRLMRKNMVKHNPKSQSAFSAILLLAGVTTLPILFHMFLQTMAL